MGVSVGPVIGLPTQLLQTCGGERLSKLREVQDCYRVYQNASCCKSQLVKQKRVSAKHKVTRCYISCARRTGSKRTLEN